MKATVIFGVAPSYGQSIFRAIYARNIMELRRANRSGARKQRKNALSELILVVLEHHAD